MSICRGVSVEPNTSPYTSTLNGDGNIKINIDKCKNINTN